jgi:hypothetical protein
MGLSYRFPGVIVPVTTESAVQDGDIVIVGSADMKCAFPGGASPTTSLMGVVMKPDGVAAASGDRVDVVVTGVYPVRAGGTITRKDLLTSNGTDGTAKTQVAGAGAIVGVIGQALESGVSGDRVATLINPFIYQAP